MAFQIISEEDPLPEKNLIIVLFGQWGVGKTSLGFTSDNPMHIDYDKGLHRAVNRKRSISVGLWDDVMQFMDSSTIADYNVKTLINDTGGSMLDEFLAPHILKMDEKFGNGAGGLGLRGYGVMKDAAGKYFTKCQQKNVDVIFVCHTEEDKDGDNITLRPKMTGGAYGILMSKADLVGYMEMKNNKITIDFNPTTRHAGKNCAEIKPMDVPHYSTPEYQTFMSDIIKRTKAHIQRESAAQAKAVQLVNDFKSKIGGVKDLAELEVLVEDIKNLSPMYQAQVMPAYEEKYVQFWLPAHLNENIKTGEDFSTMEGIIKDLAPGLIKLIRPHFGEFLKAHNMSYDKEKKAYVKKAAAATPAGEQKKVEKIKQIEQWFIDRIGKKITQKNDKGTSVTLITDASHASHLFSASQNMQGYEFSDIVAPEEKAVQQPAEQKQEEPAKEEPAKAEIPAQEPAKEETAPATT